MLCFWRNSVQIRNLMLHAQDGPFRIGSAAAQTSVLWYHCQWVFCRMGGTSGDLAAKCCVPLLNECHCTCNWYSWELCGASRLILTSHFRHQECISAKEYPLISKLVKTTPPLMHGNLDIGHALAITDQSSTTYCVFFCLACVDIPHTIFCKPH